MAWWIAPIIYGTVKLIETIGKKTDGSAKPQNGQQSNLIAGSGTNVTKPLKPVCPECNTEYEEGTVFCKKDGEKLILR